MELASSSLVSSPARPSSPTFTSTTSSSATHVEFTPLEFFKKADHPVSPHMATELLSGSDCSLSPKLSPCPSGSPKVHFSPVEEIPYLPDVKESLLYQPGGSQSPKSPSRAAYLREKSSKRHVPYPHRPSALELQFANRMTGRVCQPDFTPEQLQEHEDAITSGLSRMSFDTLYKVFKALFASHKAVRHEVATSLWEVEASERMTAFNQALHQENKTRLNLKDKQLKKIRNYFSEREPTEIDDNTDYNQAVYNNECEMLRAITAQAEIISRRLGSRTGRELLASTGEAPYLPRFVDALHNRDSITRALRSGFADAGTDTDTDTDSDFSEDDDYNRRPGQQRSDRGPQQKTKAKVPKPPRGSGLNPSGEPATDQLRIPTEQPQMSSFTFDAHAPSAGWQGDTDSGLPTQMSASMHSWSMQDTNFNGRFSHGTSSLEDDAGFNDHRDTSASEATLIQRGEIPHTNVMHGDKEGASGSILSTAEASTSQTVMSESSIAKPSPIKLTEDIIVQTVKTAMKLVTHELFGEQVMSNDKTAKKDMLTRVIWDLVPRCFGPNATFEDFICNKHRRDVANALSIMRGKFAEFAREGVFNGYRLFPPRHSVTPPITYRQRVIQKITTDADGLVFMHIYTFDQNGQVEIKAKFQNPFVISNAIRFVWFGSHQEFLGDTEEQQIERLKVIWALASAATFCSLDEQSDAHVKVDRFGGSAYSRKFDAILAAIRNLTEDELAEFHDFLQYVLVVGPTQAPS
ncbi:hypothetical protein DFJ58DRAFT_876727 [Suillus subalutaceus]|uniref:uncharacterized protein n=1 Tax=Suillus subalutaceus TaxID=48586 RepID=UPI001B861139|nr:uncharacterized protein DFJ58DRAFT_876727 [Suillus subalutaceus]KAG1858448.1 hypothetical protein DFJ58DRAFT_876727 [Suillus subalutaceus]